MIPLALSAGVKIKADCSINWLDPDSRRRYCFSTATSLVVFLDVPHAYLARARKNWERVTRARIAESGATFSAVACRPRLLFSKAWSLRPRTDSMGRIVRALARMEWSRAREQCCVIAAKEGVMGPACQVEISVRPRTNQRSGPRATGHDGGDGRPSVIQIPGAFNERPDDLKKVFMTPRSGFHLPSSGTGAWEAALTNTLSPGDKILAARFGQFSHLWVDMAQRLGYDVDVLDVEWGEGVPLGRYEEILRADKRHQIKGVLACHNETAPGSPATSPECAGRWMPRSILRCCSWTP